MTPLEVKEIGERREKRGAASSGTPDGKGPDKDPSVLVHYEGRGNTKSEYGWAYERRLEGFFASERLACYAQL